MMLYENQDVPVFTGLVRLLCTGEMLVAIS